MAAAPAKPSQSVKDSNVLGEVVVTAQKREQAINDVGLTVVAVTSERLQGLGVSDISTLTKVVPGFSASRGNDGVPVFTIRGVGFTAVQISAAPTVSTYIDEAPLPYSAMTGGTMLDLERVEVLKGPQGTLFGNNSTGGSINFIAAKPTPVFSAGVRSTLDRFGQVFAEGFVSGPISDTLGVRIAANTTQGGAWQKSYTPGPKLKNGDADRGTGRMILDWRPTDKFKLSLNLNGYYDKSDPQIHQLGLAQPSGGPGSGIVVPPYGSIETYPLPPHDNRAADFATNSTKPYARDDKFYQGVLRGDYELSETLTLTSITNYAHLDTSIHFPIDGTRIDIIEGGHSGEAESYGEELRLAGDFPSHGVHTIVGVNYAKDKVHEEEDYVFNNFSIVPPGFKFNPRADFAGKTIAAFANADWDITPQFTLTGGARYTEVKHDYVGCFGDLGDGTTRAFQGGLANLFRGLGGLPSTDAYTTAKCLTVGPGPDFLPFEFVANSKDDSVSWRIGLNYKPTEDLLVYGLVSRGYKAGAFPFLFPIVSDQFNRVAQEELTSYETGVKYTPSRTFNVSGAVFYYDYVDKQVYATQPVPFLGPAQTLANIPKSKAYGLELEATLVPVERLRLHAAATYMHTEITDPGALHLDGSGQPVDFKGQPFAYAPKLSLVFDGEYRVPVASKLDVVFGMDGIYNSSTYGDSVATPAFRIKPYTVLNASIALESDDGWKISAWARNLGDTWYWTSVNFAGDGYERTTGEPLNFGVAASYKF